VCVFIKVFLIIIYSGTPNILRANSW